jgi:ketosteroid isomerase-like protein
VLNKEQWINRHKQFRYEQLDTSEMNIRLYGDTAIVTDTQKNKATFNNEPVSLSVRVSQVWIHENSQWKRASIQFSPMAES